MKGRWLGEVVWIADWSGVGGKKGDKVTGHVEIKIIEDGNALLGRFFAGSGSATWITVYNSATKQIVETAGTSGGTVFQSVIYKKGGKWIQETTGSESDGRKITQRNVLTISKDGKTHKWSGGGAVGDKKTGELRDVWRRVSEK